MEKSWVIAEACASLSRGAALEASKLIRDQYPFIPMLPASRTYTEIEATRIFVRDGLIDRYSGEQLIFPGVFRLLSQLLPDEFPFHPNWKMSETHPAYWELFPTLDHVVPVARGGVDDETNLVTTSMLRNSAKSNWTLEELSWQLVPAGEIRVWDGLLGWFVDYARANLHVIQTPYLKRWHRAAILHVPTA